MDLYLERECSRITLEEWLNYVESDKELILSENGTVINPLTQATMNFDIPGRVVWKNMYEITYKNGMIGCEGSSAEIIKKLMEIANVFNASLFDCGEKI